MNGSLYLVSTPIGNLEDITLRGLKTLKEVDLIACEDTRRTLKLLNHYQIRNHLVSYFEHNRIRRGRYLIGKLKEGKNIALVSDAGTPGISDPGFHLVKLAVESGIRIIPIPGPTALIAALSVSGLPTHNFLFHGYLSPKKGKKRKELESLRDERGTIILYESPHRLLSTLRDVLEVLGNRSLVVTRELTKIYEEAVRGRATEVLAKFEKRKPRGEFVILIQGATQIEKRLS